MEWTCDECGLTHRHEKHKHMLWRVQGLDWQWIKHKMEYNPKCHCGVMEAKAALEEGKLFPYVTEEAASLISSVNAPLPPEVREDFGFA